jgi:hypothetical protein
MRIYFGFSTKLIDNKIIELSYRYRFQSKIKPDDYEFKKYIKFRLKTHGNK